MMKLILEGIEIVIQHVVLVIPWLLLALVLS